MKLLILLFSFALALPAQELPARRSPGYNPGSREGRFDLRVYVDASADIYIQGERIRARIQGGRPVRDAGSEYIQPIPRARLLSFSIEKKDGRGRVTLMEEPSPRNGFTAWIHIDDREGGEDRYHVRLRWTWEPLRSGRPEDDRYERRDRDREDTLEPRDRRDRDRWDVRSQPREQLLACSRGRDTGRSGVFEFRGRIEDMVVFRIRDDQVQAENPQGRPVELERCSISQPLPSGRLEELRIEKEDGRGAVEIMERPWDGNNYAAVVQVTDRQDGDARYHFRLRWRR